MDGAQDEVPANEARQRQADKIQIRAPVRQIDDQQLKRLLQDEAMKLPDTNIAISGMAGRFPKADSVVEYESNLRHGIDMVNDQDETRFQCGLWGLPPRAGRMKDLRRFDSEFFGYSAEAVNYVDYQLRILYEVVYESIIDAGVNPSSLRGTNTGVFFGLHCNEFENAMADDPQFKSNGYYAQFAVKVAQYFDLRGLTVTFDAACASGFVGLHSAVEALREGLIDQAIVCSSNIPVHPTSFFIFFQMQMLSPTGYSRFLDSRADGYVKSEACVSVLLQRKHLARRNYCSFMSTMTSVDGYKSEGITFPSDQSQEKLIRAAKERAGISTNFIEYLEAHGTGTPAGDPQEAHAISSVYYTDDNDESLAHCNLECAENFHQKSKRDLRIIGPLLVGSVKTNMGHSEAASGLCALVKIALMLENELIYKSLHYSMPNTNIKPLMDGRLQFVDETRRLNAKIVPLSCYGFGGSNVHVIVRANEKEALRDSRSALQDPSLRLVTMFGRSAGALNEFFDQLLDKDNAGKCLSDDFLTLIDALNLDNIDRLMNHRGFIIVDRRSSTELVRSIERCDLEPLQGGAINGNEGRLHFQDCKQRSCCLLFAGLGIRSIRNEFCKELMKIGEFWLTIERLGKILAADSNGQLDLMEMFELAHSDDNDTNKKLDKEFVWIVANQIALVNIARDQLKLKRIDMVLGHSLGEIACAYATGALSERESILVAYQLGKTCDQLGGVIRGKMVAVVGVSERELANALEQYRTLRIACLNGPSSVTISGWPEEIERFCAKLSERKQERILVQQVHDGAALHNELIMGQPEVRRKLLSALEKVLAPGGNSLRVRDTKRWISSVANGHELGEASCEYFVQVLCKQVNFGQLIRQAAQDSMIALELGPGALLKSLIAQHNRACPIEHKLHYINMLDFKAGQEANIELLKAIGKLYQAGAGFDLSNFYKLQASQGSDGSGGWRYVRRGTPSLGALMRWQHDAEFFVPRYPAQFSKSSAKCEMPIELLQERDKYLSGHCVEGRVLFPATGYLFLIWRVFSFTKRKIYDACFQDVERELVPIEFRNVRLMRAIILGNRPTQVYMQIEEATGRFEIKEGGSVVVDGYAISPREKPNGLLYEDIRERIAGEKLECTLNKDDIYKQFRVNGYDYGDTFQNITECSADGRYCRVKFNGHFVAMTDSILQSVFMAVADFAPTSGGLFLPTRFDYVRFQPAIILQKLRAHKLKLDKTDGALNTEAKREMMNKMLQREQATDQQQESKQEQRKPGEQAEPEIECYFDTYCDPTTGVIVTDGIEMRGVRATPAPRRVDNTSELLLESQQFVADFEEPIDDPELTRWAQIETYVRVCNSLALDLLMKLCGLKSLKPLNGLVSAECKTDQQQRTAPVLTSKQIGAYKAVHLACAYDRPVERPADQAQGDQEQRNEADVYDIKKNGPYTLLSVLDQLVCLLAAQQQRSNNNGKPDRVECPKIVRERIIENRSHLMRDLIQESLTSERFLRPLVEQVIENVCKKKSKLRLVEINMDDGLVCGALEQLLELIEPKVALDYSLAHPEPSRLHGSQVNQSSTSTFTLRSNDQCESVVKNLFQSNQNLQRLDFIVFKDVSCYSLPKQVIEKNGLAPVVSSLGSALNVGGYCLLIMRQSLTLAERILLALSEPELVGLSQHDIDQLRKPGALGGSIVCKIERINAILQSRCEMMLDEACKNRLICVGRKSDKNGCLLLLFRRLGASETSNALSLDIDERAETKQERLVLRVQHENLDWLDVLKANFRSAEAQQPEQTAAKDGNEAQQAVDKSQVPPTPGTQAKPACVWLCAVSSKERPISGLVGMMRALCRELGSENLRCLYDETTFSDQHEPVSVEQIEQSDAFKLALERDQLWFCMRDNSPGSFRHLTINEQLSADACLCSKQPAPAQINLDDEDTAPEKGNQQQVDAYVNNVTRGDLSSFAWHEAPFKWLDDDERSSLVQVAYSALNFRDIMLASGRLPLDVIPIRLAQSDCLLGLEFAGLGANSRRVMGMVSGRALATRVICPQRSSLLLDIPDWMNMREAATIPVAYATAIMALVVRGRARAGESILVHAGSGGVGQAALHLCAQLKLEAYATVGTSEKREFLLREFGHVLSEDRIFNSRDCSFELDLLRATRGRGVDLVLNSLADDKLQASVNCLADGGRFLEIGKYDMSVDSNIELLKLDTNKSFHGILLDTLFDTDNASDTFVHQLRCLRDTLDRGLRERFIKPIRQTLFQKHEIEQAFRFMAAGKHIGKVLIEIDGSLDERASQQPERALTKRAAIERCLPRFQLSKQKAYIVTGALGGFGLELCKWLVACAGARHLVLTSRQGPTSGYQLAALRRLEAAGCRVRVVRVDEADAAASRTGAHRLCQIARQLAPGNQLGGVFHLAMVLRDALLDNMSRDDFAQVCAPKVAACVHLDQEARDCDLFVAFSSVTSGKGNAGQANYAYANSCMERVCELRRARGQHALAIQWGAIGDVGAAFERLGGNNAVIGGTLPQRVPSCLATLARLLGSPFAVCSSLLPLNRRGQSGAGDRRGASGDLVGAIMNVLGIKDASKVSEDSSLGELGLDSLMAVEIRQYIEREYDMTLNIQEIRALTIAKIRQISDAARPGKKPAAVAPVGAGPATVPSQQQVTAPEAKRAIEPAASAETAQQQVAAVKPATGGAQQAAKFDKSVVNGFVPKLSLAEADFVRLNKYSSTAGAENGGPNSGAPIFFLPPIHGDFDLLEPVCASIRRPCIGLNWTRKLGSADSIDEAAHIVLRLLAEADWPSQFGAGAANGEPRRVDLVGYSFGATVGFELMLALHEHKGPAALKPGSLIMLDGSPRQIELGSQYLSSLTKKKSLKFEEKVDELLMVYVISNTRLALAEHDASAQYLKLQRELRVQAQNVEAKLELASQRLVDMLALAGRPCCVPRQSVAHAMEAFCRKYHLISKYKADIGRKLPSDCTLIRAEKIWLTSTKGESALPDSEQYEDKSLGMNALVGGQLELRVLRGDHETFLNFNHCLIGEIIEKKCSAAAAGPD